jgi:hypothetical protein
MSCLSREAATENGLTVFSKVNQQLMSQNQWQQIGSMQFGPRGGQFKKSPNRIRQQ